MNICQEDIAVLRELAQTYMEYASLPVQQEKRRLWMCLNGLQMQKPMVAIDQMPWHELDVDGSLVCRVKDPYFREVEWNLRMQIYKWEHLPADMVLNPYILLPRPIQNTGYGIEMVRHTRTTDVNNSVVGQHFINQLEEPEDIEKIKIPQVSIDRAYEAELRATAERIFEGIAPVRMQGVTMHVGLWDFITQWMGVENCYIELMDRPEFMHAIMERLTTATIAMIEQINEQKLYGVNDSMCHCSYTFDETLPGKDCDRENPITSDGWAFGLAQLFTSVSPAITDEFEVAYMKRIFPYLGAIYYGCCDRLDDRMDVIRKLPKIRKLSCSPWSVPEAFAEKMPDYCVMSNKPNPAFLANGHLNEDEVRSDIRRTIAAARAHGRNLELLLKDISTVSHNPACLWRWQEIAMEELQR